MDFCKYYQIPAAEFRLVEEALDRPELVSRKGHFNAVLNLIDGGFESLVGRRRFRQAQRLVEAEVRRGIAEVRSRWPEDVRASAERREAAGGWDARDCEA